MGRPKGSKNKPREDESENVGSTENGENAAGPGPGENENPPGNAVADNGGNGNPAESNDTSGIVPPTPKRRGRPPKSRVIEGASKFAPVNPQASAFLADLGVKVCGFIAQRQGPHWNTTQEEMKMITDPASQLMPQLAAADDPRVSLVMGTLFFAAPRVMKEVEIAREKKARLNSSVASGGDNTGAGS